MKRGFEGLPPCTSCFGIGKVNVVSGKPKKCSACMGSGVSLRNWPDVEIDKYRHNFIKNTLRRSSYRWPWRSIAIKLANIRWGFYVCKECNQEIKNKEKEVDHISPVVPPEVGFTTWDSFGERLLIRETGWQILCPSCHEAKTAVERVVRTAARKARKQK